MASLVEAQDDYPRHARSTSSSNSPSATSGDHLLRERKKKQQQQPRQLLSCSKCRERKVKCDRTKPCSACCARGHPKECQFALGEGTEFGPIQQSLELRKLRQENQRFKERYLLNKVSLSAEGDKDKGSITTTSQKRFGTGEPTDSLYFGTPGLATVIAEFANLQIEPKSLSHTMPRGMDMYVVEGSMYPFPAMWDANTCVPGLYSCFQPWEEVSSYLDSFLTRSESRAWPRLATEITRKEVERFLTDFERNAVAYPDMLALVFAALATGLQTGSYERNGNQWSAGSVSAVSTKGDLFVAATMQALRMSSFMSQPTLLSIQALLLLGPYLINTGRFLDAWSLFGTTIRSAQAMGLHRNPRYLNPQPTLREDALRKRLWWWILHTDQQYSMTLGRPLGISGMGDSPFPDSFTTDQAVIRTEEIINKLTIYGRQILGQAQLVNSRIDGLSDKLLQVLDTLPENMQFKESWIRTSTPIPEESMAELAVVLHCKVHNYLILLHRQRLENNPGGESWPTDERRPSMARMASADSSYTPINAAGQTQSQTLQGRPRVIQSCVELLYAFEFFHSRLPAELIDWTIGQQAFNACMILLLDMQDTHNLRYQRRTDRVFAIFKMLDERDVHKLARVAVTRISLEMTRLRDAASTWSTSPVDAVDSQRRGSGPMSSMGRSSGQAPTLPPHAPGSTSQQSFQSFMHDSERFGTYNDTVMGNTGMFLLEDTGLQGMAVPSFSDRRDSTVPYSAFPPQNAPQISQEQLQQQRSEVKRAGGPSPNTNTLGLSQHTVYAQQASAFAVGLQPRMYQQQNTPNSFLRTTVSAQGQPQLFRTINAQEHFAPMHQYPPATMME